MAVPSENEGMEALHLLKSTEPPTWLVPSDSLANATRTASQYLFSRLQPHVPKSPFDRLLVQGFDAEQIWQQLDLQSQPLLSSLRRQVKQWEKNPEELIGMFPRNVAVDVGKKKVLEDESERKELYDEEEEEEDVDMDDFDDEEEEEEDVDMDDFDDEEEEEEENGEGGDREEEKESGGEEETGGKGGVEDKFLKIKDLQEFLEEDEAREYGLDRKTKKKKSDDRSSADEEEDDDDNEDEDEDEEEEEEQGEDEDDEDELGIYGEGDDEDDDLGTARYEDFFGAIKKTTAKGRSKLIDEFEEESESGDEQDVGDINEEKNGELSTHEKQLQKLQLEIERMEKENLEAKHWTMQGEVTAANRPENSALGEVLDFERKVRPPVEISKEFTASLEEMIKNRIIKGQFDDIERIASVPSKAPRERKELDDNKSKKGLAEVYEEEYVQETNPAAAPSSFTDEQKKEASMLFKKLCLKLDALSHFHFAPKPVIEDMSIQANVPALAMEEIAPTAVSDAAMLAPEEVFSGKGDIKDKAELTQAERKRRRANKKRKFKAETAKRMAKKPRDSTLENDNDGEEEK